MHSIFYFISTIMSTRIWKWAKYITKNIQMCIVNIFSNQVSSIEPETLLFFLQKLQTNFSLGIPLMVWFFKASAFKYKYRELGCHWNLNGIRVANYNDHEQTILITDLLLLKVYLWNKLTAESRSLFSQNIFITDVWQSARYTSLEHQEKLSSYYITTVWLNIAPPVPRDAKNRNSWPLLLRSH